MHSNKHKDYYAEVTFIGMVRGCFLFTLKNGGNNCFHVNSGSSGEKPLYAKICLVNAHWVAARWEIERMFWQHNHSDLGFTRPQVFFIS